MVNVKVVGMGGMGMVRDFCAGYLLDKVMVMVMVMIMIIMVMV